MGCSPFSSGRSGPRFLTRVRVLQPHFATCSSEPSPSRNVSGVLLNPHGDLPPGGRAACARAGCCAGGAVGQAARARVAARVSVICRMVIRCGCSSFPGQKVHPSAAPRSTAVTQAAGGAASPGHRRAGRTRGLRRGSATYPAGDAGARATGVGDEVAGYAPRQLTLGSGTRSRRKPPSTPHRARRAGTGEPSRGWPRIPPVHVLSMKSSLSRAADCEPRSPSPMTS